MNQLAEAIAALKADLATLKIQLAMPTAEIAQPANDHAYRQAVNDRIDRIIAQLTPDSRVETRVAA